MNRDKSSVRFGRQIALHGQKHLARSAGKSAKRLLVMQWARLPAQVRAGRFR